MSFTIVKDEGDDFNTVYQIRATIGTRVELEELIAKLNIRLSDFPQGEAIEHHPTTIEPVHPRNALPAPGARTGCTGAHTQQKAQEDGFNRSPGGD